MRKIYCIIIAAILLITSSAWAGDIIWPNKSTQTATATITTGSGIFGGIIIATDATNAVTLNAYDGTSTAGTKLFPEVVITTSATDRVQSIAIPVRYYEGIHITATSAGTFGYTVYFKAD